MSKLFELLFPLLFVLIGFTISLFYLFFNGHTIILLIVGTIFSISGLSNFYTVLKYRYNSIKSQHNYAARSFEWYISANPNNFQGGQLTCNKCGSRAIIHTLDYKAAGKQIFSNTKAAVYQRHKCKQCCSTLFYTPENDD